MFHASMPTAFVLSPLQSRLEKVFLFPTYAASHMQYLERNGFLRRWASIGSELSVSLYLPSELEQGRVPCVHIAIRSDRPEDSAAQVALLVEAEGPACVFQETMTIYRVGTTPRVVALPSIPLRWMEFPDDNHIVASFKKLRVWVVAIDGVSVSDPATTEAQFSTTASVIDLLNERFEQRWGAYWNMGAVDRAAGRKAHWLAHHLVHRGAYSVVSQRIALRDIPGAMLRHWVARPLCWLLTRSWLLKVYFWTPIFLRKGRIDAAELQ